MEGRAATIIRSDFCNPAVFFVQVLIAAGNTGDAVVRALIKLLDARHGIFQNAVDTFGAFIFTGAVFRDLKHARFGQIQQFFAAAALRIITCVGDFIGDSDHLSHHRTFTHDVSISADIRRAGGVFRHFRQVGEPACGFQLAFFAPVTLTG
ncbi:hypothetical protein OS42_33220 [Dickeya oryzae]